MEIMYDSTLRLQDSIEDILQLASLEANKSRQLALAPTDIRAMLESILAMQRLPAQQRQLTMKLSGNWPATLELTCDQQRLKRVFNNLISNAIKYSRPETQISIGYGRANDGAYVIWIQDHGIGIPVSEQAKVWSGFYRASNTATNDPGGTGMGLYLSRSVIEQHGGRIWLESEQDKGTTVYVSLPENLQTS
jgi:signal transduction histidine kinase